MNSYIATVNRRVLAKLVDYALIGILTSFFIMNVQLSGTDQFVYISIYKYLMIVFAVPFVYDFTFLVFLQQTPGKWVMQIKVAPIGKLGKEIDLHQAFLRSLSEHLLGFIGLAYFIPVLWRYDRRHWGDCLSDTIVVQVPPRMTKSKTYPLVGVLLFLIFAIPAMESFSTLIDHIDWKNQRIGIESTSFFDEIIQIEDDVFL